MLAQDGRHPPPVATHRPRTSRLRPYGAPWRGRLAPPSPPSRPPDPGRPTTSLNLRRPLEAPWKLNINNDPGALLLPPAIALELGIPLAFKLGRRLSLQNKLGIDNSWYTLTRRRRERAGKQVVAELVTLTQSIKTPTATLGVRAVHRLQNFGLYANAKQLHPLVRGV